MPVLGLGCLDAVLSFAIQLSVGLHDHVEIGFVDHGAGLGALGLLLQVLAQKIEVELAVLDHGAGL